MARDPEALVCRFQVPGTPEELKAWWTDLPDVYEAEDPREQPHRIERVEETEEGTIYDTFWHGPLGMEVRLTEILHDEAPGRWRFEVPATGFRIVDRYVAEPTDQGTELTITSTMSRTAWYGRITRPLMLPRWRDQLAGTFSDAIEVYRESYGDRR